MSSKNIVWHDHHVSSDERASIKEQTPCVLWFTGLSGSGKSTVANAVESKLLELTKHTYLLDGDNVRMGLNKGLTFSDEDRIENIRRTGEVSKLFVDSGLIVLTAFISPFANERNMARKLVPHGEFIEIYCNSSVEVCEQRDVKGLYKKAREGLISDFTGISSPYEEPVNPELMVNTGSDELIDCVKQVIDLLENRGLIARL